MVGFPARREELIDTMSLDEYLIENKEATYILKVKGLMIGAGIREGDLVIVERTNTPRRRSSSPKSMVDHEISAQTRRDALPGARQPAL